ncbi:MAG: hypothetical protein OEZ57_00780 [Nitrospirota bacterium]|nr:hypothetical protein [Nitrospira sp.]MDH5585169.1 hypothetical protein [Nitrospirota bacterium]MDH5773432.1 hypothetical protein [Nitrospirota bacterium]
MLKLGFSQGTEANFINPEKMVQASAAAPGEQPNMTGMEGTEMDGVGGAGRKALKKP